MDWSPFREKYGCEEKRPVFVQKKKTSPDKKQGLSHSGLGIFWDI